MTATAIETYESTGVERMKNFIAAIEACMDDDISMDAQALWIGTPGSFVTLEGGSEKYPKSARELVAKYRPMIHRVFTRLTQEMGIKSLVSTSHEGCGAMGIQGIEKSEEVAKVAQEFAQVNADVPNYVGHVTSAKDGLISVSEGVSASVHIDREEHNHEHSAYGLVFTTGGFISGEEMAALQAGTLQNVSELQDASKNIKSEPSLKKYFVVSVDAMARVIKEEGGSEEDVVTILRFIKDLAETIMHGTLTHKHHGDGSTVERPKLRVVTFDAGRLPNDSKANEEIVRKVMTN